MRGPRVLHGVAGLIGAFAPTRCDARGSVRVGSILFSLAVTTHQRQTTNTCVWARVWSGGRFLLASVAMAATAFFELRGDLTRYIADARGEEFTGVRSAAVWLRRRGMLGIANQLAMVDDVASLLRHASSVRSVHVMCEVSEQLVGNIRSMARYECKKKDLTAEPGAREAEKWSLFDSDIGYSACAELFYIGDLEEQRKITEERDDGRGRMKAFGGERGREGRRAKNVYDAKFGNEPGEEVTEELDVVEEGGAMDEGRKKCLETKKGAKGKSTSEHEDNLISARKEARDIASDAKLDDVLAHLAPRQDEIESFGAAAMQLQAKVTRWSGK